MVRVVPGRRAAPSPFDAPTGPGPETPEGQRAIRDVLREHIEAWGRG